MTLQHIAQAPHDFPGTIDGVTAAGPKLNLHEESPIRRLRRPDLRGSDSRARQRTHPSGAGAGAGKSPFLSLLFARIGA
jgi:hypothetical protein